MAKQKDKGTGGEKMSKGTPSKGASPRDSREIRRLRRSFGDNLMGKGSPLLRNIISALEEKYPNLGGEQAAVTQEAGEAIREWFTSKEGQKAIQGALMEQLGAAVDERISERMGGGDLLTSETLDVKLAEMQASIHEEMDQTIAEELEEKLKSGEVEVNVSEKAGPSPAELKKLIAAQIGESGGGISDAALEEKMEDIFSQKVEDIGQAMREEIEGLVGESLLEFMDSDELKGAIASGVKGELVIAGISPDSIAGQMRETIKAAIEGAFNSTLFNDAVQRVIPEGGSGGGGGDGGGVDTEGVKRIAKKVTEEILMREAQGLVKQVKIEINKVTKKIGKMEADFGSKIEAFFGSDDFKILVGSIAEEKAMDLLGSDEVKSALSKGGGELASPGQIQGIVDTAVKAYMKESGGGSVSPVDMRNTVEEILITEMPKHVGKFLDDKLPPPEYFENLATISQVREEIERKVSGSGVGVARGAALSGNPGESAVFTNMISRILGSDDLKEMIDDKFKVINNYIKNELVPRVVKKMLKEKGI
jgi:hypothetical protein